MADKLYLVKATIQTTDRKGAKVVLLRSDQAQPVPAWLVKELKAEGVIDAADDGLAVGKAGGAQSDAGSGTDGSGDENSGD